MGASTVTSVAGWAAAAHALIEAEYALFAAFADPDGELLRGECLMVCVRGRDPHKEMSQNDYCGTTRPG